MVALDLRRRNRLVDVCSESGGIAGRSFKRTFELAEYIKVTGAQLENGLLSIQLKREVPEAMKPRTV